MRECYRPICRGPSQSLHIGRNNAQIVIRQICGHPLDYISHTTGQHRWMRVSPDFEGIDNVLNASQGEAPGIVAQVGRRPLAGQGTAHQIIRAVAQQRNSLRQAITGGHHQYGRITAPRLQPPHPPETRAAQDCVSPIRQARVHPELAAYTFGIRLWVISSRTRIRGFHKRAAILLGIFFANAEVEFDFICLFRGRLCRQG